MLIRTAVASKFTNIIGALIEAYMILNLCSRVSTIENTYLKSSFLRSPTFELSELIAGTRWILTSDELISFVEGGQTTLAELQEGTDTIATTNEIYQWINPLHRAEVLSVTDYIATYYLGLIKHIHRKLVLVLIISQQMQQ